MILLLAADAAPWWSPLVQTLAGAVIALIGSIAVPFATEHARRGSEKRALASSIIGELSGVLLVIREREYLSGLEWMIENESYPYSFEFGDVGPIYLKAQERIGLLGAPAAEKVVVAYNLLFSALEDVKKLKLMHREYDASKAMSGLPTYSPEVAEDWVNVYRGLFRVGSQFVEKAEAAIQELRRVESGYPS
jgi:hypothetical protein